MKKAFKASIGILLVLAFGHFLLRSHPTRAATTIEVNSTADTIADDGECTLREAIIAANNDTASGVTAGECAAGSGVDTITFNIVSGTSYSITDRNSVTKTGYIITPLTALPPLDHQVTIDGFSQPGSLTNTAVAPAPINSTLLIQIDGTSAPGANGFYFSPGSDGSTVKGLVISNFTSGSAVIMEATGVKVQGNNLGTAPDGLSAASNGVGINNAGVGLGTNTLVGGLQPEDRNIVSGNSANGSASSGAYPSSGWTIQGNYIGLAANGTAAIPNSVTNGPGGFSIDSADGVTFGGSATGAMNVISGNSDQGLAPDHDNNLHIEGNYIGTDYTGVNAVGNAGPGINLNNSADVIIKNNIISGNGSDGFYGDHNTRVTFQGNKIGVNINNGSVPNGNSGITMGVQSTDFLIGGTGAGEGNIIANNGTNNGVFPGIALIDSTDTGNTILGNTIYNNDSIGIELGAWDGPTANDAGDADTGPNDLLNFPVIDYYTDNSSDTTVHYNLDVPAGSYRIEYFSNTTADSTGYGGGQVYLGAETVSSTGSGSQSHVHTLSGITGKTNIAMTTTLIDSNAASNFGPTSEFSAVKAAPQVITDIAISKTLDDPQDVAQGAIISYTVTFTNNGPSDLDLTAFDGSGGFNMLFADMADPDLTFVSNSNPNIGCNHVGTITDIGQNVLFPNHADYGAVFCSYVNTIGSTILLSGQSISTKLQFQVAANSDLHFSNYAMQVAVISNDPDAAAIQTIFGGTTDAIDALLAANINNAAEAVFPIPVTPPSDSQSAISDSLANTGSNIYTPFTIGLAMSFAGLTMVLLLRKKIYRRR